MRFGVDIVACCEPINGGRQFADHLPGQRAAAPEQRLGAGAFAGFGANAECRHVDHQRRNTHCGKYRADRALQTRPAVEQLAGADLIGEAMRVNAEDGGRRSSRLDRTGQVPAHGLPLPVLELKLLENEIRVRRLLASGKSQRVLADLERFVQSVHR